MTLAFDGNFIDLKHKHLTLSQALDEGYYYGDKNPSGSPEFFCGKCKSLFYPDCDISENSTALAFKEHLKDKHNLEITSFK